MFTRRQLFPLFVGAAATLTLPGLVRAQEPAKEFRIGWQKGGVFALAKADGSIEKRLADRGIAVSWNEFTSGPPLLEALGANAIDFGSTGDVPPLFAQAAGGDLVYVAATKGAVDGSAILVAKGLPDPDARRPQGQEARLQAWLQRPQLFRQGLAHSGPDAR